MDDHPLQRLVDAMNADASRTRSGYHLTLGGLVDSLRKVPPDAPVRYSDGKAPGDLDSYRGSYIDLAIEDTDARTAGSLLKEAEAAIGHTFTGYKGGDFKMHAATPLWRSDYGVASGVGIMDAVEADGALLLVTRQVD